ncbi:MAG: cation-transporting P-type ATPase [Candidatus Borkfalkiaceae bacterium]|nr:cation-transporting P-type ATPase [Clostridia bacterium]MDY6223612.1 cation-transporting P-type ATPase [Christensenellaceae bacterium]
MPANAYEKPFTAGKDLYGLSEKEVLSSRERHGENTLKKRKRKGFFHQYLSSFSDPIIRILLIALAINLLFLIKSRNVTETVGIAVAVFVSTFVSTVSEYGSESAFEALMAQSENAVCRVRREGKTLTVNVSELVVGDILLLEAGERVPADGTVLFGKLTVSQSPLTGESAETEKTPEVLRGAEGFSRREKVFEGSVITAGEAVIRVGAVGERTFYGQMASALKEDKSDSPLKRKLTRLANTLSRLGYAAAALVAIADLFNAFFLDNNMNPALIKADFASPLTAFSYLMHALTLAIAVVVVAVPEGLPMMIAVVLSSNRVKMAKDNVLVKRAAGIEAAGGMQILFTDKTGTLTKGTAAVTQVITGGGEALSPEKLPRLLGKKLAACACLNGGNAEDGGNAADRALRAALKEYGGAAEQGAAAQGAEPKELYREKFDAKNKYALVSVAYADGRRVTYFQGAPEMILPRCSSYFDGERNVPFTLRETEKRLHEQTRLGKRVIALACLEEKREDGDDKNATSAGTGSGLPENASLLGLAVLSDELRKEARGAVEDLRKAGVQVVMITGDHAETATAIAKEAGLFLPVAGRESQSSLPPLIVTGSELAAMTDEEVMNAFPRLKIVARALPTDKSRLVTLAKRRGYVTGMTGDGINDAAALKKADVGFALGSGTEVAKEAGDVVITDDNLSSVVKAAAYGRRVFKSIRQFVVFQLTMNLCAVGVSMIAPFIGYDTPITVMQMLWINMIMDTLASLAFAGIKVDPRDMTRPPKPLSEPVLTKTLARRVAATGAYCVLLCMAFLKIPGISAFFSTGVAENKGTARFYTAFFSLFVFSGLFGAFHARTDSPDPFSRLKGSGSFVLFIAATSACQIALLYFGGTLFRTTALTFTQLAASLLLAATVLPVGSAIKFAERLLAAKKAGRRAEKAAKAAKNAAVNTNIRGKTRKIRNEKAA